METNSRNCTCVQCNMSFCRAAPVKTHTLTHSAWSKDPHLLKCEKSFGRAKDLNRHMITWTGEKAYKCAECGYLFARARNLKRHFLNSPSRPCDTPKIVTSSRKSVGTPRDAKNNHYLKRVSWELGTPCETQKIITSSRGSVGTPRRRQQLSLPQESQLGILWEYPIRAERRTRYARLWVHPKM